jgi:serine/threonine-protein kinase HipA
MVFNVVARNCDDHTKNFAFLMDSSGKWSLAPAFDLCHTYSTANPWVNHQALSVNGRRLDIKLEDLMSVAKAMNVRKAKDIIEQVNDVVQNWSKYAGETGVDGEIEMAVKSTLLKL